ncbi:MAG: hypothetical protein K2Q18_04785, partial [Bdellovibrionales bacterium]|nr:hypothetical protein [Bdellovibrionales bacterium]
GNTALIPGISAVETNGHTPGHSVYLVESKGQKLLLVGDLIHMGAIQFPNPTVTIQFDSDSKKAMNQRLKTFTEAAKGEYIVGAAHIPFPGLGHLRQDGKKYIWFPLNYTSL